MLTGDVLEMEDAAIATDVQSLREWFAHWGDGPHHADPTGETVPIAKASLAGLLAAYDRVKAERDAWRERHLRVRPKDRR